MANELRARFNLVSGALSSSLTNVATSMSSAGLANLGVVDATNHAAITIENEIVWVTAHTAGATTATILRHQENTSAAAHSSGVAWEHGPTALDFSEVVPAAARRSTVAQSMVNLADNLVTFNINDVTQGGCSFPDANRISVPAKGIYAVSGTVRVPGNATAGWDEAAIFIYNSSNVFQAIRHTQGSPAAIAGVDATYTASGLIFINAGDRVAMRFWTNKGTRNNNPGNDTTLEIAYVGAWA